MKEIKNGEVTGEITPPLPHDEYAKNARENAGREARAKARATKGRGKATVEDEDEHTFAGRSLDAYDGMSDDDILDMDGVGEATLHRIKAAQKKRG